MSIVLLILLCLQLVENTKIHKEKSVKNGAGKSSLVFVFDTTGSMYNDLKQLRDGAELIFDTALEESNVISNFVFVPFHDPEVGPATVTTDKQTFKSALNIVKVYGGGDCPEKSLSGLLVALNVSLPGSFVYVFTDATASDHELVGKVLDAVMRKQSQVVFVLTGHCNDVHRPHYKVYQQIAAASSGLVFNLNKTSVHNVLDFVRSSIKGRLVNLGASINPAGHNLTQEIPIDASVGEVTVSVSGLNPRVKVLDPRGEQVTPPQLATTLDLAEIMVVKVKEPMAGNWSISVRSEQRYAVRVAAASELGFTHGFSTQAPSGAQGRSYRPLKGTYNYMMISLTETNHSVTIDSAQILTLDGKILFEVPLKHVDSRNQVYLADAFMPPDDLFYIAIVGHDGSGQEVRRVGSTAVQATLPDAPYLTTEDKQVRVHGRAVLSCAIESLVPVTAWWGKDGRRLSRVENALQSTVIDYIIEDMTENKAGIYKCVATNVAGTSTANVELQALVDPPVMTSSTPENVILNVGTEVVIHCSVYSESVLSNFEIYFNGSGSRRVIKPLTELSEDGHYSLNMTFKSSANDSGTYICKVINTGGEITQTTNLTVLSLPKVTILSHKTVEKVLGSTVSIPCVIENGDASLWVAPNGTAFGARDFVNSTEFVLNLYNVSLADEGVWTCYGINMGLQAQDSFVLNVTIKPKASIQGPHELTVLYGAELHLVCTVTGKPRPDITWSRYNNQTVMRQTNTNTYTSWLSVSNLTEAVEGRLSCSVRNSVGSSTDYVLIDVRRFIVKEAFTDMSVEYYSTVKLRCLIDSFKKPIIKWYHNDTELSTNYNVAISPTNDSIVIYSVQFEDLGTYTCLAENEYGNINVSGVISVYGLEPPIIYKGPKKIITQEGQSATLPCKLTQGNPYPIIYWQHKRDETSDFSMVPSDEDSYPLYEGFILSRVDVEHGGRYRCLAENVVGDDYYDLVLVVQYPPQILDVSNNAETIEVKLGSKITMKCDTTGEPTPTVFWSKNGQALDLRNDVAITANNALAIDYAQEHHSGNYSCFANNTIGSKSRDYHLIVYDRPKILQPTIDIEIEVLEGKQLVLPCLAVGIPEPKVNWKYNGRNLILGGEKTFENGILKFTANLTDFGEYTCIAANHYGNDSLVFSVYVWVPPSIVAVQNNIVATLGGNITLQCDGIGYPIPKVTWEFEEQILLENTTELSFTEFGNLFVWNASRKHEGTYSCVAYNTGGVARQYISVQVNEPPKILSENFTGPYIATEVDRELVLSCRTTGKPTPNVVWRKDGRLIRYDNRYEIGVDGSLTMKSLSRDTSGTYTCIARNYIADVSRDLQVRIYSLPTLQQGNETHTNITLMEGSDYTVDCPLRASLNDSVKWYKNAIRIPTAALRITNVTADDESTYSCVISNAAGSWHHSVHVAVVTSPRFTSDVVTNVTGVDGDDVWFNCDSRGKPDPQITWYLNNSLMFGQDKYFLNVKTLRLYHRGNYSCIVVNDYGKITRNFTLDVYVPPFISIFDIKDVQVKEGANTSLECNSKGIPAPQVIWSYNNTLWHTTKNSIHTLNATRQSEGIFQCAATNAAGRASLVYRVQVVVKPRVEDVVVFKNGQGISVEGRVESGIDSNLRISCLTSGNPAPIIKWIQNGNTLSENDKDIIYADLTFTKLKSNDSGVFTCLAVNEAGMDERIIKLDVLEPPTVSTSLFKEDSTNASTVPMEVLSGRPFHLHCHPYGNPIPQLYWFKDDVTYKSFDQRVVLTAFGEILFFSSASVGESGNYTCVAVNKVGRSSVSYLVDVLESPLKPKGYPKTIKVLYGQNLTLNCPVSGWPFPTTVWIKHPYLQLSDGMNQRIKIADDNYTLVINSAELSDAGDYSCQLTNKVGSTEVSHSVIVHKAPSIRGERESRHEVHIGESLILHCDYDGVPKPQVVWYKNSVPLNLNLTSIQQALQGKIITIWQSTSQTAAQYSCVVRNEVAVAQNFHNVYVKVPGKWSEWSSWSYCNVTCGDGYQARNRSCQYVDDYITVDKSLNQTSEYVILDEMSCKGGSKDRRKCRMPPCEEEAPVGEWSAWSLWSVCSATCDDGDGAGAQTRTRRCRRAPCTGDNVQIRKCPNLPECGTTSANEVRSREEISDVEDIYVPEATFEMETEPEVMTDKFDYETDAEEFYMKSGTVSSNQYYDVEPNYNSEGNEEARCDAGYRYDNATDSCHDVDECKIPNNRCHSTQVCVNTAGGYRCQCEDGYLSLGPGQRCLDINECEQDKHGCEFACVNTAGGYVCACPKNLRLHMDRRHCVPGASYRKPLSGQETNYLSTHIHLPTKRTKYSRN